MQFESLRIDECGGGWIGTMGSFRFNFKALEWVSECSSLNKIECIDNMVYSVYWAGMVELNMMVFKQCIAFSILMLGLCYLQKYIWTNNKSHTHTHTHTNEMAVQTKCMENCCYENGLHSYCMIVIRSLVTHEISNFFFVFSFHTHSFVLSFVRLLVAFFLLPRKLKPFIYIVLLHSTALSNLFLLCVWKWFHNTIKTHIYSNKCLYDV